MIARISGRVVQKNSDNILVEVGGISYQVFLPQAVMQGVEEKQGQDAGIDLITYHYHQVESSRAKPILIGFINEIEKDFFEQFITVSGIGPRAAMRALNKPISMIAQSIYEGNVNFLSSLPGIGKQRAKEIVAKLQNKVGKFGLIRDSGIIYQEEKKDIAEDALAVLLQLQYKKSEARMMINKALENSPQIKTSEELLNEIYKQKQKE
ncbi:MAG: Holliday junction DNA helicase RuvA [Candidatus Omnitrophica bacterium]|nr:Holliday junction DNA helicase RuvA [Candidatus Omnitrophota bacterium]MBU1871372.1 Holliday junction DNA helicase RuvA [Candidatus Omnitrophota bacterium]